MKKKIAIFAAALLVAGGSFVLNGVLNNSSLFDANVDALARPLQSIKSSNTEDDLNKAIWMVFYPKQDSPDHNCCRGGSEKC